MNSTWVRFCNYYDPREYAAEMLVREAWRPDCLPRSTARDRRRDSTTGETREVRRPVSLAAFAGRQPSVAVIPAVGDADRVKFPWCLGTSSSRPWMTLHPGPVAGSHVRPHRPEPAHYGARTRRCLRQPRTRQERSSGCRFRWGLCAASWTICRAWRSFSDCRPRPGLLRLPHHLSDHQHGRGPGGTGLSPPPFASYVDVLMDFATNIRRSIPPPWSEFRSSPTTTSEQGVPMGTTNPDIIVNVSLASSRPRLRRAGNVPGA